MGKVIIISVLLFFSGWVNAQKDIFEIARNGTVEELKMQLKEKQGSINSVNNEGYSLLTLATYRGNNEVAAFLIKEGAEINGKSNYGTPLMAAVVKGNTEIVKLLLENNADTGISDATGNTALIYAVIFKKYEIAELLVKAKANINATDIRGKSALDYAKMVGDDRLIQILNR
ncbi:ankyrin repeat domain-containing protein [Flavobacterium suncheonense]|uniref:Uncharacterized protein n=1 Tax=Flavobacterium suncheonense GH29-5 = DSM 17707 TaxID=1121899 RepID=A0A0A2MDE6_9FLAO|nr:ankyrin repeat domain-containing protein [Flavobacterium suncheonense]KGO89488.1 hypothetical protein Q764_06855 [Flavobacterium suncheonense GH29-5 = DSM 17707]